MLCTCIRDSLTVISNQVGAWLWVGLFRGMSKPPCATHRIGLRDGSWLQILAENVPGFGLQPCGTNSYCQKLGSPAQTLTTYRSPSPELSTNISTSPKVGCNESYARIASSILGPSWVSEKPTNAKNTAAINGIGDHKMMDRNPKMAEKTNNPW